jgi:hypothetical protein
MNANYRVVRWATRNIGRKALRSIIDHSSLKLAAEEHVLRPRAAAVDRWSRVVLMRTGH